MHLYNNSLFFLFLALLISLVGCTSNSQPIKPINAKETKVDLCIIDAPDTIKDYLIANDESNSLEILFLNSPDDSLRNMVFAEPDSLFLQSDYINGFYADYLSWKANFWPPNPTDTVNINYWLNHKTGEKTQNNTAESKSAFYSIQKNKAGTSQVVQLIDSTSKQLIEQINATIIIRFVNEPIAYTFLDLSGTPSPDMTHSIGFLSTYTEEQKSFFHLQHLLDRQYLNTINIPINSSISQNIENAEIVLLLADRAVNLSELSIKTQTKFSSISVTAFQNHLCSKNHWLFPQTDVHPEDQGFGAYQKLVAANLIGPTFNNKESDKWRNTLSGNELDRLMYSVSINHSRQFRNQKSVRVIDLIKSVWKLQGYPVDERIEPYRNIRARKDEATALAYYHHLLNGKHPWFGENTFNRNQAVTLSEASLFIDLLFNPLERFSASDLN
jgi:hypothetical protein